MPPVNMRGRSALIQNNVNEGTREVYQSGFEKLPILHPSVITGLEDDLNVKQFKEANIYPNPAQNYINVSLGGKLQVDFRTMVEGAVQIGLLPRLQCRYCPF